MKKIIGIDIGRNGGVCIMEYPSNKIIEICTMPVLKDGDVDGEKLFSLIIKDRKNIHHCYMERLHSMAFFGAKNNFTFGGHYAVVKTLVMMAKIPFTLIRAKDWQANAFRSMPKIYKIERKKIDGKAKETKKKVDTKAMALKRIKELYPTISFKATERCKKDHDGMIDAVLIALFSKINFAT